MFFSTVRAFVRHSYVHTSTLSFISKIRLLSLITWKIFVISLLDYISCEYWLTTTFLWNSFCTTEAFLLEYCKSKTGHLTGKMTEGMWQAGDLTGQMTGQVMGRWLDMAAGDGGLIKWPKQATSNTLGPSPETTTPTSGAIPKDRNTTTKFGTSLTL